MTDVEEISLRPLALRPLGAAAANPFSAFGKGAGFGIKANKTQNSASAAAALAADEHDKKPAGPKIKYSKEFLLLFMERYAKCPIELQHGGHQEIVLAEQEDKDTQRQILQRVADEVDDRDWRSKPAEPQGPPAARPGREYREAREPPREREPREPRQQQQREPAAREPQQQAAPQQQQQQQQQQQAPQQQQAKPATAASESAKIVRAADVGLQAYRPGGTLSASERSLRQIKGILNKLTPEKFERLLDQLLQVVTTADVLQKTIAMVFENAVAQPTFCAMYADLCLRLSRELPSFPPADGEDKPMTFRRVLLNTCQDEFEDAAIARDALRDITDADERAAAEKRVKLATMGNIRLIAELYRKDVVKENILHLCISDLLKTEGKQQVVSEDAIEACCEMITIAGKTLAATSDGAKKLDGYTEKLDRFCKHPSISVRVRFLVKDIQELKRNKWVPRRETFTAKKLDEVHAEAEAELGMISSRLAVDLPALPAQVKMAAEDFALLPPLRSGGEGWDFLGRKGPRSFSGESALLGEYQPPKPISSATVAAVQQVKEPEPEPAAEPKPKAPAGKSVKFALSAEEVEAKTKAALDEYLMVADVAEAVRCFEEIAGPDSSKQITELVVDYLLNAIKEKQQEQLVELLAKAAKDGVLGKEQVEAALAGLTETLEDLSLDVPKAPELLGKATGALVLAGALPLTAVASLVEKVESAEPRRAYVVASLKAVKNKGSDAQLQQLVAASDFKAGKALEHDPSFDGDMPSPAELLKSVGLGSVPV